MPPIDRPKKVHDDQMYIIYALDGPLPRQNGVRVAKVGGGAFGLGVVGAALLRLPGLYWGVYLYWIGSVIIGRLVYTIASVYARTTEGLGNCESVQPER
jgi:hypothetical protein